MNDKTHKNNRPYILYERAMDDYDLLVIVTFWGLVMVHRIQGYTELRFAHDGSMHTRYIKKTHTPRYCITLAERFAGEIGMG